MKTKNELFLDAVDYLIDEGFAADQGDLAKKAGLGPNLISRVRNGKVKNVSHESIRAIVSKFNLNPEYFKGKSEQIMLAENKPEETTLQYESPQALDNSFLLEKYVDKMVREKTADLQARLADKERYIERINKDAKYKDQLIEMLRDRICELEAKLNSQSADDILKKHPFPIGVADDGSLHITVEK